MHEKTLTHRLVAGSLVATLALSAWAPAALAGHGHGKHKKWKRYGCERVVERVSYVPAPVVVRESSCGVPAFAGFVGGIALGAVLASASRGYDGPPAAYAPPPPPAYSYWDPYCHQSFVSLDVYLSHTRYHHRHPRVVRVVEVSTGDCCRTLCYDDGRWTTWDGGRDYDWDDD